MNFMIGILVVAFTLIGILFVSVAEHFATSKPTEEEYLKTNYYNMTNDSYEDAMKTYDGLVQSLCLLLIPTFVIGILSLKFALKTSDVKSQ